MCGQIDGQQELRKAISEKEVGNGAMRKQKVGVGALKYNDKNYRGNIIITVDRDK
jgi:hypothetical protein